MASIKHLWCNSGAVLEQFQSNCRTIKSQFRAIFKASLVQFDRAVIEQFQSYFTVISQLSHSYLTVISEHLQGNVRTDSKNFQFSRAVPEQFQGSFERFSKHFWWSLIEQFWSSFRVIPGLFQSTFRAATGRSQANFEHFSKHLWRRSND